MEGPYTLERIDPYSLAGKTVLVLVGPSTPREDGYLRYDLPAAEIECAMLNEAFAAGFEAGKKEGGR